MNSVDRFCKDKQSFLVCISLCATLWFLALCFLFGFYIWCSFKGESIVATQTQLGDYSNQGVAGGTVSIN